MPITDDVIISAIVIASCQIDEISNCPEIIELKNMVWIRYISRLAFPIHARIGFNGFMSLERLIKHNVKAGSKNNREKYL